MRILQRLFGGLVGPMLEELKPILLELLKSYLASLLSKASQISSGSLSAESPGDGSQATSISQLDHSDLEILEGLSHLMIEAQRVRLSAPTQNPSGSLEGGGTPFPS
jgi:hypothetical protein